ncbi:MAG: hypothetical protein Q8O88_01250 [bacterium]|nr:hypothetical protein [bacterium]
MVPTIREDSIQRFLLEWQISGLHGSYKVFIIEDNPTKTFKIDETQELVHYSHQEIDKEFPIPEIIGRKTDAVRIFGFWKAYQEGFDYILTLDDDCYPANGQTLTELIASHLHVLKNPVNNPRLFNTMVRGFARGVPDYLKERIPVKLSVGGWMGIPDIDGKTQLFLERENLTMPSGKIYPDVVPYGQLFTFSGMHACFPRDMVKYMYYFPHLETYYRLADIWLGFCLKKICDQNNWAIVNAGAVIKHSRASNATKNYTLENTNDGYSVNEVFSKHVLNYQFSENNFPIISGIMVMLALMQEPYFEKISIYYGKWNKLFR